MWPGDAFKVEMALGSKTSSSVYDTAVYGTGTYGGAVPEWVNVSQWCESVSIDRGAERFDDRIKTGIASFLFDNREGRFNPAYGTASLPGALEIRPGRWVRVLAEADGESTYLFAGYIDTLTEQYGPGGDDVMMKITAYDFAGMLAQYNPPAASSQGSGETTGARVERVLDDYGWLDITGWRDIDTGDHTMQATTLSQNYLAEIQDAAAAEAGAFFFDGVTAVFRDFDWPAATTASLEIGFQTVEDGTTWTDDAGGTWTANGDIEVFNYAPVLIRQATSEWSAQNIRNDVRVAYTGGSEVRVQDTTSQALYERRTWQRYDYELDNATDMTAVANKILDAYSWDYQRLRSVTITALTDAALADIANVALGDLVSCYVGLILPGWDYQVDAHVMGIEWDITADDWAVTYRLDDSTRTNPEA